MSYERPGHAVRVTASADVLHGQPASDDGHVGRAIKTATPASDAPRATRGVIVAGEAYNIRPRGVMEVAIVSVAGSGVAAWDITGVAKGQLVYVTDAGNALSLAAGAGKSVLGKVTHLAGEQGTPTNRVRVDLQQKV
jgi:hypothetical protein